jgi:hypothetical protein
VGTRKISQLDTISDANLSGEAILPVVVSDPLIPNRKAKVNQLFRGVSQGTKTAPGLCFDLDRDSGLYQNEYDQIGIGFGDGGFYMSRIDNGNSSASLYITAVDDTAANANIVLSPKGTGSVQVTGNFVVSDQTFILEDAQGPRARFEVSNIGTGTNTRIFTLPAITSGNGTTIVGDDTSQTLRNKTILIDEDNFVIVDGDEEAIFQINWATTTDARRSYFLPDAGTVTTTAEPTATSSTLIDTKAEQTIINKTLVNPKFATNAEEGTAWVTINTTSVSANRTITVPDLSLTLVGTDATQILTNKTHLDIIFADSNDITKKANIDLGNANTLSNESFRFPNTSDLNRSGSYNYLVTDRSNATFLNKKLQNPVFTSDFVPSEISFNLENLTANRTIKFPDADATLLSTDNVTVDDVSFGAGISAANLTGMTRLQQFFYSGF